ncbi:hypothetical protein AGOR_G00079410 [Albula goreensis]|uniref:Uncharacterized protein n=1 Tax=Albula goreensis TaxID=1534307 RepID=A0A8T3DQ42_9TELE|nr:hypothetical protein AGOR_G00079410 [Albula goreensis]
MSDCIPLSVLSPKPSAVELCLLASVPRPSNEPETSPFPEHRRNGALPDFFVMMLLLLLLSLLLLMLLMLVYSFFFFSRNFTLSSWLFFFPEKDNPQ